MEYKNCTYQLIDSVTQGVAGELQIELPVSAKTYTDIAYLQLSLDFTVTLSWPYYFSNSQSSQSDCISAPNYLGLSSFSKVQNSRISATFNLRSDDYILGLINNLFSFTIFSTKDSDGQRQLNINILSDQDEDGVINWCCITPTPVCVDSSGTKLVIDTSIDYSPDTSITPYDEDRTIGLKQDYFYYIYVPIVVPSGDTLDNITALCSGQVYTYLDDFKQTYSQYFVLSEQDAYVQEEFDQDNPSWTITQNVIDKLFGHSNMLIDSNNGYSASELNKQYNYILFTIQLPNSADRFDDDISYNYRNEKCILQFQGFDLSRTDISGFSYIGYDAYPTYWEKNCRFFKLSYQEKTSGSIDNYNCSQLKATLNFDSSNGYPYYIWFINKKSIDGLTISNADVTIPANESSYNITGSETLYSYLYTTLGKTWIRNQDIYVVISHRTTLDVGTTIRFQAQAGSQVSEQFLTGISNITRYNKTIGQLNLDTIRTCIDQSSPPTYDANRFQLQVVSSGIIDYQLNYTSFSNKLNDTSEHSYDVILVPNDIKVRKNSGTSATSKSYTVTVSMQVQSGATAQSGYKELGTLYYQTVDFTVTYGLQLYVLVSKNEDEHTEEYRPAQQVYMKIDTTNLPQELKSKTGDITISENLVWRRVDIYAKTSSTITGKQDDTWVEYFSKDGVLI